MENQHEWLKKEIAKGFMLLSALNLKGRPAAKDLTAVAQLWYGLLLKQKWQPDRDVSRVKMAFENIAVSQNEWPNPSDLIRYLPPLEIKMVPRLDEKHTPTTYGKQQAKALKQKLAVLKTAPCMNREWIHGQRHRTVDECRKIYADRQKGIKNE